MAGTLIPNDDQIARYCKPSCVEDGVPLVTAFLPRNDESYLSVNWLEYFRATNPSAAVDRVRDVFCKKGYGLRPNGRFAVLNVGAAKMAVYGAMRRALRIEHLPLADDDSHAGIVGYSSDDLAVALELAALVGPRDVHPPVSRSVP